jgi:hypothetical protein
MIGYAKDVHATRPAVHAKRQATQSSVIKERTMRPALCLLIAAGAGMLQACEQPTRRLSFEHLEKADRIVITKGAPSEVIATCSDTAAVSYASNFIRERSLGWTTPWYGTPVPSVVIEFYRGDTILGWFGIGRGFVTSERAPRFDFREVDPLECESLLRVVGVDPEVLR